MRKHGTLFGTFEVPLLGAHNVRNALAGIAVCATLGIDSKAIAEGLKYFAGVKRRLELRGSVDGIEVYDDFAHHPTAVAETIAALRLAHPTRRIWAIFEPRSASSCLKMFQSDFVEAFEGADEVVVAPVFRSKVAEDRRLSPEALVADLVAKGRQRARRDVHRRHRRHRRARSRVRRSRRRHVERRLRRRPREAARARSAIGGK